MIAIKVDPSLFDLFELAELYFIVQFIHCINEKLLEIIVCENILQALEDTCNYSLLSLMREDVKDPTCALLELLTCLTYSM